jgi:hypothetical protein
MDRSMTSLRCFEELVSAASSDPQVQRLVKVIDEWKRGDGAYAARTLFSRVREALRLPSVPETPASVAVGQAWTASERELSASVRLMTPYELCRAFDLLDVFESVPSGSRAEFADGLRVDPLAPDEDLVHTPQPWMRESEQWRQQFFMRQDDPFVSAIQAEARAPLPRQMLDGATLSRLRQTYASRGIDFKSERPLTLDAKDVHEAIQLACLLRHERTCDLFRGQALEWNPIPGFMRSSCNPAAEVTRFGRFREWAHGQDALRDMAKDDKRLAAIAQHYGLPTMLLDFSRSPRVAAFFAMSSNVPPDAGPGCIYCIWSGGLAAAAGSAMGNTRYHELVPKVDRVEIHELHRMHAQEGSFIAANNATWMSHFRPDVIRFPRHVRLETPTDADIYPSTRSEIEGLVETYFANNPA